MNTNEFLASRLEEVFINGIWIANTNYKAQLQKLSWEKATEKVSGLNTIAALTFHINYYLDGILEAFKTGELTIKDQYSFDDEPINNQNEWNNLVETLLTNAESLIVAVRQLNDDILNSYFFDKKYGTYYRNIAGVIEHSYYHLGQIVMLNKLISK
jgi:uncharacterized damage-inducible protein DinB